MSINGLRSAKVSSLHVRAHCAVGGGAGAADTAKPLMNRMTWILDVSSRLAAGHAERCWEGVEMFVEEEEEYSREHRPLLATIGR